MPTRPKKSDLALRLATAGVWVPFLLWLLFWAPRWTFPSVAALVCLMGAAELFGMVARRTRSVLLFGVAASLATFCMVAVAGPTAPWPLVVVGMTCAGLLVSLFEPNPIERAAERMAWAVAGPFYVGGLFGSITALYLGHGGAWVLLALMCSFLSDTAGYFVGRAFGRRSLSQVSPKKTVEGSLGGLAGGLLSGLLAHLWFLPELSLLHALGLALAATLAGQAGDLCESLIKRSTGVKDSGTRLTLMLLRGHGGILDRADAMLFSAATIWAYTQLFL